MNPLHEQRLLQTRRQFFGRTASGIGIAALASLLDRDGGRAGELTPRGGLLRALHHAPKAKRVIYLFMSGGPSHIDLIDYKPALRRHHGEDGRGADVGESGLLGAGRQRGRVDVGERRLRDAAPTAQETEGDAVHVTGGEREQRAPSRVAGGAGRR